MNAQTIAQFYQTLSRPGDSFLHAGHPVVPAGSKYPGSYVTACGLQLDPAPVEELQKHPTCPACVAAMYAELPSSSADPVRTGKLAAIRARHSERRPGPYRWQMLGGRFHLLEQATSRRMVVLSVVPDPAPDGPDVLATCVEGRLVPLTPDHPDAQGLAWSWADVDVLLAEVDRLSPFSRMAAEAPELIAFSLLNGIVHNTRSRGGEQAPDYIIQARNVLRWKTVDGIPPEEITRALSEVAAAVHVDVDPLESLQDLLGLVGYEIPLEEIHEWPEETQEAVSDWAAAVHMRAGDHDDVEIPPRPGVLDLYPNTDEPAPVGTEVKADD